MKPLLFALALALPNVLHAGSVPVNTATGQVQAPLRPTTVAVLDFAAIDTLRALDVPLAGRPDFAAPAHLAKDLADVPTVGTLFEPDFEALAVMAPDLIVAGGRSQSQVEALSKFAPTLDMTIAGTDLIATAKTRLDAYGAIFGREDRAKELDAQLDAAIGRTAEAVKGKGNGLILMTNGGKISAYGTNSRFGWLHKAIGLPEAVPGLEVENHGEAVSFEFVAKADPDWLLVIDRAAAVGQGGEAAAATLDNPLIAGTKAGQKGQIIYLDGAAIYLADGGVQSLLLTLEQLDAAFSGAKS